jgi:alpha-L-rhamnosidase
VDTLGYHSRYGQSTAINALYYSTLNKAAEIALTYGDYASWLAWKNKADIIKNVINTILYLPTENRYITNLYQGIAYPPTPLAQAFPLSYGIVPSDKTNDVASSLLELLSDDPSFPNVGVYGMYWVINGLGEAGRISEALDTIKLYYGHMIDSGATTWWEYFNANQNYSSSLSHGWGSYPTWFLSTYVLGFTQLSADSWQLKPVSLSQVNLDSVVGTIPIEGGSAQIVLSQRDCQNTTIYLFIPSDSVGTIILPTPETAYIVELDGEILGGTDLSISEKLSVQLDGFKISPGVGSHRISVQQICQPATDPTIRNP